jgi:hypothetical protein
MSRMTLFFLSLCLFASTSFGSAKLILKPSYVPDDARAKFMIGLSVYEPITESLFYNGFFGGGVYDREAGESWYKTSQGVVYKAGPVNAGVGVSYQLNQETHFDEKELYTSLSLNLW